MMDENFEWEGYGSQIHTTREEYGVDPRQEEDGQTMCTVDDGSQMALGLDDFQEMGFRIPNEDEQKTEMEEQKVGESSWNVMMNEVGVTKLPWELTREDVVNKVFPSLHKAEEFFMLYAKTMGFSVRRGQKRVTSDGAVRLRDWWCSKQGHRRETADNKHKQPLFSKPVTREGCKVQFRVNKVKNVDLWVVKEFIPEHSHPLACADHIQFLRSSRTVPGGAMKLASAMRQVGVKTSQIMSYMAVQVGGYSNVPFTPKDLYNAMYRGQQIALADSDAMKAIGYLQHKADHDSTFYAKYTYDSELRLENLFWSDSRSRSDYKVFGHALAFDTTYRSNKYGKPLLVLVGINHHYKSTIFGLALLKDESLETYKWALEAFVECMNGVAPMTVMTDGDLAMQRAIQLVMPTTVHRLCTWHLQRNAVSNVKDRQFVKDLQKFFRRRYTVDQFDRKWNDMVVKYSLQENVWVTALYGRRQQWAETFFKGCFFGGMTTTQRCEGMNWFLKSKGKSTMSLADFVRGIDLALSWMRYNEAQDDYESVSKSPTLGQTNMEVIEVECAKLFTRTIFYQIRHEILKEGKFMIKEYEESDERSILTLEKYDNDGESYVVEFDRAEERFYCHCDLLARKGMPCRHMFASMKHMGIVRLPCHLVDRRWTKGANKDLGFTQYQVQCTLPKPQRDFERFGALNALCTELSYLGSHSDDIFAFVKQEIAKLVQQVRNKPQNFCTTSPTKTTGHDKTVVQNPLLAKTKGAGVRMTSDSRRLKRCSNCNRHGHNKKTCDQLTKKKRMKQSSPADFCETGMTRSEQHGCSFKMPKQEDFIGHQKQRLSTFINSPGQRSQHIQHDNEEANTGYDYASFQHQKTNFLSLLDLNDTHPVEEDELQTTVFQTTYDGFDKDSLEHPQIHENLHITTPSTSVVVHDFTETQSWWGTPFG